MLPANLAICLHRNPPSETPPDVTCTTWEVLPLTHGLHGRRSTSHGTACSRSTLRNPSLPLPPFPIEDHGPQQGLSINGLSTAHQRAHQPPHHTTQPRPIISCLDDSPSAQFHWLSSSVALTTTQQQQHSPFYFHPLPQLPRRLWTTIAKSPSLYDPGSIAATRYCCRLLIYSPAFFIYPAVAIDNPPTTTNKTAQGYNHNKAKLIAARTHTPHQPPSQLIHAQTPPLSSLAGDKTSTLFV